MRPKVSVILPFYNSKDYIRECIESLLNQTLTELEIICVDDGSKDGSFDIIKEYKEKDDRIVLVSKSNKGYGNSMNLGFSLAKGEYVGILESDDYAVDTMFERLYAVANENDLDFVKSDFSRFYREGATELNEVNEICKKNPFWYNSLLNPSVDPSLLDISMNTWTGIYKSEFIKENRIRHNETPGASFQDNGFWFQTFCWATRAMFLNETFYHVRRDNPNSSVNDRGKVYCMAEEYKFILNFLKANPEKYELFIYMYHRRKYHNYMFTLDRIDDRFRIEFLRFMQKEYSQALLNQELKVNCFTKKEWSDLTQILESPKEYYVSRYGKLIGTELEKSSGKEEPSIDYKTIEVLFNSTKYEDNKNAFNLCEKTSYSQTGSLLWLGRMYRDGKGVEKNLDKAIEWMSKAKDAGLNSAKYELMDMLISSGTKEDDRKAFEIASSFAKEGNGGSMGRLGRMYRDGKGIEKNLDKAIEWMSKAKEAGLNWADYELMDLHIYRGEEDDRKAFEIASSLAKKGNAGAMGRLGRMYRDGKGVKINLNKAIEWMSKAKDAGLNWANQELINMPTSRNSKGVDKDSNKAAEWMRKDTEKNIGWANNESFDALWQKGTTELHNEMISLIKKYADEGDGGAMGRLGRAYRDGKGVEQDLNKAAEWMRKAAEKNIGWANNEMFDILWRIGTIESHNEMISLIKKYADEGDGGAMGRLGRAYRDGKGVEQDLNKAAEWMRKAAEKNIGWANNEMFDILWRIGTIESHNEMISVIKKYADEGDGGAMGRLGRAYRDGKGVEQDLNKAAEWMRKAAEKNIGWANNEMFDILWRIGTIESHNEMISVIKKYADEGDGGAMGRLGRAYRDGKGVEQDLNKAAEWMRKAAEKNIGWANNELFRILLKQSQCKD